MVRSNTGSERRRSSSSGWFPLGLFVGAALVLLLLISCSSADLDRDEGARPTPSVELGDVPTEELLSVSESVRFRAADGVRLEGRMFGEGEVGLVLAHMSNAEGQEPWWGLAASVAEQGYRVLTYNRRGVCPGGDLGCSGGEDRGDNEAWKDIVGGVAFLRSIGTERVAIGGASLGAMESLFVAGRHRTDVDGVIWVAGTDLYSGVLVEDLAPRIDEPKLIMAGEFESGLADVARNLYAAAEEPKELVLLDTGEHGTDVLAWERPAVVATFRQAILDLLAQV